MQITVIATNVLLRCAATEGNSPLDKETRIAGISASKLRGRVLRALLTGPVIVPKKVEEELFGLKENSKLSPENKKNLKNIINSIEFTSKDLVPNTQEVKAQHILFLHIEKQKHPLLKKFKDFKTEVNAAIKLLNPETGTTLEETQLQKATELRDTSEKTPSKENAFVLKALKLHESAYKLRPPLIPDLAIYFTAKRCCAYGPTTILTGDNDFLTFPS
jgi:hypothetical protein